MCGLGSALTTLAASEHVATDRAQASRLTGHRAIRGSRFTRLVDAHTGGYNTIRNSEKPRVSGADYFKPAFRRVV